MKALLKMMSKWTIPVDLGIQPIINLWFWTQEGWFLRDFFLSSQTVINGKLFLWLAVIRQESLSLSHSLSPFLS